MAEESLDRSDGLASVVSRAVCLSIGCVVGLHLAVAIDDGIQAAIRRLTGNLSGNVQFFGVVSVICVLLMAMGSRIYCRWFERYAVSPVVRLLSGTLMMFLIYYISTGPSRWGLQTWGSSTSMVWLMLSTILATCPVVVFEAWLTGSRGLTEQDVPDLSELDPE